MRLLCHLCHQLLDFRVADVEAAAAMAGCDSPKWHLPHGGHRESPFWYIDLPSEKMAVSLAGRAALLKGLYVVWAEAETWAELLDVLKGPRCADLQAHISSPNTYKFKIETLGMRISRSEGTQLIQEALEVVSFQGTVDLENAARTFTIIRSECDAGVPAHLIPTRWYIGREVATGDHSFASRYKLQSRPYKGSTAMPAELAQLMCNQAKVIPGSLVYDPFVGTGSILLAASHFRAITIGMDIDTRVLHPGTRRSPGRCDIFANFRHYNLELPAGVILGDTHRPPFRPGLVEFLDAIVCDPPYGIRERARKTQANSTAEIRDRESHVPSTLQYGLGECVWDLLNFAASMLRPGGRLVFWLPSLLQSQAGEEFPIHPCLRLVHSSTQLLGGSKYGRRLMTLEKVGCYNEQRDRQQGEWNSLRTKFEQCLESIRTQAMELSKQKRDTDRSISRDRADGLNAKDGANSKTSNFRSKRV